MGGFLGSNSLCVLCATSRVPLRLFLCFGMETAEIKPRTRRGRRDRQKNGVPPKVFSSLVCGNIPRAPNYFACSRKSFVRGSRGDARRIFLSKDRKSTRLLRSGYRPKFSPAWFAATFHAHQTISLAQENPSCVDLVAMHEGFS